ncbi:GNAT family N-acetyltransferase [Streptomyces sp. NPDC098789]|uniref:GNAT family N-acetyltransferase n=1 Tax=Streptomyces sp. NPDC098789 TaxID=3366098 RepID=UPI003820DD10
MRVTPLALGRHLEQVLAVQCRANRFDGVETAARGAVLRRRIGTPALDAVGAFRAGELVGYAYGAPLDDGWPWARHVMAELGDAPGGGPYAGLGRPYAVLELHVDPGSWRQGVGRALLHRLCAPVSQRWVLLTRQRSATAAGRFYAALGFSELGVSVGDEGYVAMAAGRARGGPPSCPFGGR